MAAGMATGLDLLPTCLRLSGAAGPTTKLDGVDMWPLFHALALHPLLLLRGEVSDLLSAEAFDRMRAAAPEARFAVVRGVGHAPMLDEPEAIAAIDAFLAALAP